jgi:hypothetical protein
LSEIDRDLSHVHPDIRRRYMLVEADMEAAGHPVFVSEGLRGDCRQESLYKQGRAFINGTWEVVDRALVVTNAPFGRGNHRYGLALDIAFKGIKPFDESHPWETLGQIVKKHGFSWGGDWPKPKTDRPHAEKTYGFSAYELRRFFADGGLPLVWSRIDQCYPEKENV